MDTMIRPYRSGEEEYVADLHKRLYSEEYNWGPDFIDYAVEIPMRFARKEKNDREELLVADHNGQLVGCIMLCGTDDPHVGQLRVFAVEKEYRCQGIGAALLETSIEKAISAGYTKLILWTADAVTEAIHKYEKLGFKAVETKENYTWSTVGEAVTEIKMEMDIIACQ